MIREKMHSLGVLLLVNLLITNCLFMESKKTGGAVQSLLTAAATNSSTASNSSNYSISGTISGLSQSGLSLSLNSSETLTLASTATSFNFSTLFSTGESYSIVIASQPTGQTCVSSNNSGTIETSNISNITIICSIATYTIGGTVTGLSKTSLSLQLSINSGASTESLTISSGSSSFSFTSSLNYNNTYIITTTSNPATAGNVCTLVNSSGTVSSNVTNVSVDCYLGNSSGSILPGGGINPTTTLDLISSCSISSPYAGQAIPGNLDNTGASAKFYNPYGITSDGYYLYVADNHNNAIRQIRLTDANVTTITSSITGVVGVTIERTGSYLYVSTDQNTVDKIQISNGTVTNIINSGLSSPQDIITDNTYLYLADSGNHVIKRITISDSSVTVLAGLSGTSGTTDAVGSSARFNTPTGLALSSDASKLYVSDTGNHRIRQITLSDSNVTTIAGSTAGYTNANATSAQFDSPRDINLVNSILYISDSNNYRIRSYDISTTTVSSIAGSGITGTNDGATCSSGGAMGTKFPNFTFGGIVSDGTSLYITQFGAVGANSMIRRLYP